MDNEPLTENPELEIVLDKMQNTMDDLYGASTRSSGNRAIASITPFATAQTRSNGEDPVAYIVNFENNSGFAVVSTDDYSDDIITISNNGNLSMEELEFAYGLIESEFDSPVDGLNIEDDDMEDDPEDILYGDEHLPPVAIQYPPFSEDFISNVNSSSSGFAGDASPAAYIIADYIRTTIALKEYAAASGLPSTPVTEIATWVSTSGVAPLIRTKWDQSKPYNNNCPLDGGVRTPAGCVTIATGQIAAYYRKPSNENWNVLSNFGVYNSGTIHEPEEQENIVATYIRSLGSFLHVDYDKDGSSALTSRAAKYFRQQVDLDNVVRHRYSWSRVRDRLNLGCPVYMHGHHSSSGHAWVIDGYLIQSRLILKGSDTKPQERKLIHINWGWSSGYYDGYYAEGTFDPSRRALTINVAVGDGGNSWNATAYTRRLKILTWKKP